MRIRVADLIHKMFDCADVGLVMVEIIPKLAPSMKPIAKSVLVTKTPTTQLELTAESATQVGQPVHWFATYWPLLEGDRAIGVEDAVRRNEAQFRAICDGCPLGVFLTDEKGSSLYSTPVNLAQMGLTLEEAQGDGWQRAIHPDDRARVAEHVTKPVDQLETLDA